MDYLKEMGLRIATLRKSLNITQDALAQMTGYTSRSSINKIEKGMVDIPQSKIVEFAKALGTTPTFILGTEENTPEEPKLTEGERMLLEAYRRASDDVKPVLVEAIKALENMPIEALRVVAASFRASQANDI